MTILAIRKSYGRKDTEEREPWRERERALKKNRATKDLPVIKMTCLPYYMGIEYPMNIIFFLANTICSLVSVFGNSVTIMAILTRANLQTTSHWLLAALSFTDLLAGAIAQPMYSIYLSFFADKNNCVLEKSIVFMSATSCMTSLLLLAVIGRDRFLHVSKGMRYNEHMNNIKVWPIQKLFPSTCLYAWGLNKSTFLPSPFNIILTE